MKRERQYIEEELTAATTGPIVSSVVLYSRVPFGYVHEGRLPDGSPFSLATVAWPVAAGYTSYRLARRVAEYALGCWWCDADESRYVDCPVMMVDAGGSLLLFATCERCIERFGDGPDYCRYDPNEGQTGFPEEAQR